MTAPDPQIAEVLDRHPAGLCDALNRLRDLIMDVAAETAGESRLVETLKWGQPSYLTEAPKSGATVRIDADASHDGDYALYVPCSTTLVAEWRDMYPHLVFGGDRSVHFRLADPLPEAEVRHMVGMAMTYHRRKKS